MPAKNHSRCKTIFPKRNISDRTKKMNTTSNNETLDLELDVETAEKFSKLLNDESLMHAGFVAHQSNNNVLSLPEDIKIAA
jgi:hypothetical protein